MLRNAPILDDPMIAAQADTRGARAGRPALAGAAAKGPAGGQRRRWRERRSFTLIEAVLAVVILAVSVPPMVWSLRRAHATRVHPMYASQARWLAIEKLEDIVADRHSTTRGYAYLLNANYAAEASVTGFTNFARSVSIAETAVDLSSAGTGYKKATVTVSWTDTWGTARSIAIATVLTDYTP